MDSTQKAPARAGRGRWVAIVLSMSGAGGLTAPAVAQLIDWRVDWCTVRDVGPGEVEVSAGVRIIGDFAPPAEEFQAQVDVLFNNAPAADSHHITGWVVVLGDPCPAPDPNGLCPQPENPCSRTLYSYKGEIHRYNWRCRRGPDPNEPTCECQDPGLPAIHKPASRGGGGPAANGVYTVVVDAADDVPELDETNNSASAVWVEGGMAYMTELLFNAPGADQGLESVEIQGPPGMNLTGWWLIVIEGDGTVAGVVDQKVDLSAWSTGPNGLLLIRDTLAVVIQPPPDPGTDVVLFDFTPDLENGANTYVLGRGNFPYNVGDDLDLDNDGTLDNPIPADFFAVDAASYMDGTGDQEYADDFGGQNLGLFGAEAPWFPGALYRLLYRQGEAIGGWAGGVVLGTPPGPFGWDAARNFGFLEAGIEDVAGLTLDPGHLNHVIRPGCVADLDGDYDVDQADLGILLSAFGGCPGDGGFDAGANTAFDSLCVNQADLGVLLSNFGQPCPQ